MKGFKSFAEPTTLHFEPGISVIVGPNGSGKSNIVDAISWVLGAQGAKGLRGSRMEDVIFAGAKGKPPLGRAEVSLVLDNSAAQGALGAIGAEIRITRTLFRNGDSEYALNGTPCRLLDVQELLSDAGVGRSQHVIIGQGRLDAVLEARPDERRGAIEEAAGILKHRRRKERALRRLDSAEQDAQRLEELCEEIRRQCRPLRRQAEAAQRHEELAARHESLRLRLAESRLASLAGRVEETGRALEEAEEKEAHAAAAMEAVVARLEAEEGRQGAETSSFGLEDLLGRATAALAGARSLQDLVRERSRAASQAAEAPAPSGLEALLGEQEEREKDREESATELEGLRRRLGEIAEARAAHARKEADLVAQGEVLASGEDAGDPAAELERQRQLLAERRARLAAVARSASGAREELDRARRRSEHAAELAVQAEGELASALAAEAAGTAAAAGAEARLAEARERAEAAEAEARSRAEEAAAARAACAAAVARAEALGLAMRELWDSSGTSVLEGLDGVLGPLAELVSVETGWEQAFMAAAGDFLSAVVTRDDAAGREAVARLREASRTGSVVSLSRRKRAIGSSPTPAGAALAGHVGAAEPEVEALLADLVGDVVAVSGGWEEALEAHLRHGGAVVSAQGDLFSQSGWKVGPVAQAVTAGALSAARAEAETLEQASARASARAAVASEEASAARADLAGAERARSAAAREQLRLQAELSRAEARCGQSRSVAAEAASALCAAEQRILEIQAEEQAASAEAQEAEEGFAAATAAQRRYKEALAERQEDLARRRAAQAEEAAGLDAMRREAEVSLAAASERHRYSCHRLDQLGRQIAELSDSLAAHREGIRRAAQRQGVLEALAASLSAAEERAAQARQRLSAELESRRKAASERSELLSCLRSARKEAAEALEAARERTVGLRIAASEAKIRLEDATAALGQERPVEVEQLEPEELAAGEAELAELEKKIASLGPVNPLAASELAEAEERLGFIEGQLSDVHAARRDLLEVLSEIDGEIDRLFSAAFEDVSRNFSDLVATVFPGGQGSLSLVEQAGEAAWGVELSASPAGKSVRRLSLLSGGERSLVALAFEFALFRSRPSPFYVMDEVEAALDDTNLSRFLSLAQELRHDSQLLIVSHQKRTMEMGDCLYGVTMQRAGASAVISQRLGAAPLQSGV